MKRKDLETLATLSIELQGEEICELLEFYDNARVCVDDLDHEGSLQLLVIEFSNHEPGLDYESEFDSSDLVTLSLHIIIPDYWKWKKTRKAITNIDKYAQNLIKELREHL